MRPEDSPEAPEPTPTSQAHGGGSYQLQFGSFSQEDYARELVDKLAREGQDARVETLQTDQGTFYRVRGGSFSDEGAARNQADKLRGSGLDAFVVRP